MVKTRQSTLKRRSSASLAELSKTHAPSSTSKIPNTLRFPLLVLISLTSSSVLYSLSSAITAGDLSSVSKSLNDWWEITGLLGWKTAQLAVGWWGGYDGQD